MKEHSKLQALRIKYQPHLPIVLREIAKVCLSTKAVSYSKDSPFAKLFPKTWGKELLHLDAAKHEKIGQKIKVGVVFSGGQASGGHNVIAGLFDALKEIHPESELIGFLGGPSGIIEGKSVEITTPLLLSYRNQGGFDLIGSGRTKIETEEQMKAALQVCQKLNLQGLVVIGGDDSNTNAAFLAEFFSASGADICVAGVPKTIDGDLRSADIEISFGFDTACKIYSELIGNIARDALSAKKYYHFIRLMGRSASHITLECALSTRPNLALIGEEIAKEKKTLKDLVDQIADLICKRSDAKKDYGVILIPEGVIEFIPEMKQLLRELNALLAQKNVNEAASALTPASKAVFQLLPETIQNQLLLDRDPHGNVQVSKIETERLFVSLVTQELKNRKRKFNAVEHFLGYEGRCGMPSNFDANYCYSLGYTAAVLLRERANGYIAAIGDLTSAPAYWKPKGVPIASLFTIEKRQGKDKPVIQKALVDLDSKAFKYFASVRESWELQDCYLYPGPIQFFGEEALTNSIPQTLTI
jgi:diphosphate-dependent phosphofructokinase